MYFETEEEKQRRLAQQQQGEMSFRDELKQNLQKAGLLGEEKVMTGSLGNITYYDEPQQNNAAQEQSPLRQQTPFRPQSQQQSQPQNENIGIGLIKKVFSKLDSEGISASGNSANDFAVIAKQGWNNIKNINANSLQPDRIKKVGQDTIDSMVRGALTPDKYNNLVGSAAKFGAKLINPEIKNDEQSLNDVYNFAKNKNEENFQNSLKENPVASRAGYYLGAGANGMINLRKPIISFGKNLSSRVVNMLGSQNDIIKNNIKTEINNLTPEEVKRLREEEHGYWRRF